MPSPVASYASLWDLDVLPPRTGVWMRCQFRSRMMPLAHDGTYWGRRQSRRGDPLGGFCHDSAEHGARAIRAKAIEV